MLERLINRLRSGYRRDPFLRRRVEMTCSCRDADSIPKVPAAGQLLVRDGCRAQRMHQGLLVPADGYYGDWMTDIIRRLKGHHEPQEELLFHHVLSRCRPGSRMVEIGAYWAYYTAWFLGSVPGGTAVCLEPDENNAACGLRTLSLNGLSATWVRGAAGRSYAARKPFWRDSDGVAVDLDIHSFPSLLDAVGNGPVELLHVDAQGAELPFLESLEGALVRNPVRFVFVSTHDQCISGSPTTHEDCLRAIVRLGAAILEEHSVEESFSGDGLIVASFDPSDRRLPLPKISRNESARSLFGFPGPPGGDVLLAASQLGPMVVRRADSVIGRSLIEHGRWEEDDLVEVVRFLRRSRGFVAREFVSVGANIGTDLLRAVRGGMFQSAVGIEMDPENFRLLEVNCRLNLDGPPPLLLNVALGERIGDAFMERSPDNFGDHRIRSDATAVRSEYGEGRRAHARVAMTTLDQVERDHGLRIDASTLIWIDTQGYEGHVLAGAGGILARPPGMRPTVVCELWPYGVERAGGRDRLMHFLRGCAAIHDLRASDWEERPPLSFSHVEALYDALLSRTTSSDPPHTDLLCVP
jgi:FkbM family methyltransferase